MATYAVGICSKRDAKTGEFLTPTAIYKQIPDEDIQDGISNSEHNTLYDLAVIFSQAYAEQKGK